MDMVARLYRGENRVFLSMQKSNSNVKGIGVVIEEMKYEATRYSSF